MFIGLRYSSSSSIGAAYVAPMELEANIYGLL